MQELRSSHGGGGLILTKLRRSIEEKSVAIGEMEVRRGGGDVLRLPALRASLPGEGGEHLLRLHPGADSRGGWSLRVGAELHGGEILAGAIAGGGGAWSFAPEVSPDVAAWRLMDPSDPSAVFLRGLRDHGLYLERTLELHPDLLRLQPYFQALRGRSARTLAELGVGDSPCRWMRRLAADRLDLELPPAASELWRAAQSALQAWSRGEQPAPGSCERWLADAAEQERCFLQEAICEEFLSDQEEPALAGLFDAQLPLEAILLSSEILTASDAAIEVFLSARETLLCLLEEGGEGAAGPCAATLRVHGGPEPLRLGLRRLLQRPSRAVGRLELPAGNYRLRADPPGQTRRIWVYTLEKQRP